MDPFAKDPAKKHGTCPFEKSAKRQAAATTQAAKSASSRKPRASQSQKAGKVAERKEQYIKKRSNKDGSVSYCVQIRRRTADGQVNVTHTCKTLADAKIWRDNTLAEIQLGMHKVANTPRAAKTVLVSDLIAKKLTEGRELGRSAVQVLKTLQDHRLSQVPAAEINFEWFRAFATELHTDDRLPQTMTNDMAMLAATLKWARRRGSDVPIGVVEDSMQILWEDQVLQRSEERDRRPKLWELDEIFETAIANKRQKLPVVLIAIFAIYSGRRISEICRLQWKDLRPKSKKILVRKMKHPRKKMTNDVWVSLEDEALAIIERMPRTSEFIFPYNAKSLGTAFQRTRDKTEVEDLHFHDLRHEAVTRLFELGKTDQFVMKISGHQSRQCLDRYAHVEEARDKFENWKWLDWVLNEWQP